MPFITRVCPVVLVVAVALPLSALAQSTAPAPAPAPTVAAKPPNIIAEVRAAIAKGDFAGGERLLNEYRQHKGITPEALEALSWLGRGALAAKQLDKAENYALETYDLSVEALKTRKMDDEPRLPIAIGAAIEVRAHVTRSVAPAPTPSTCCSRSWRRTARPRSARASRRTSTCCRSKARRRRRSSARVPRRRRRRRSGPQGQAGRAVLLGALVSRLQGHGDGVRHADGDATAAGPDSRGADAALRLRRRRAGRAGARRWPTSRRSATSSIRGWRPRMVPVSEENFKNYGASTAPTVVLVDRAGIVRLYHPGQMTLDEIEPHIKAIVDGRPGTSSGRGR